MNNRGVSFIGILLIVVLIGIGITVAFPLYRANLVENARSKVCETNLKTLKRSLDIFIAENGKMPADLSQIPLSYTKRAYAQVIRREGAARITLAKVITGWENRGIAHAALLQTLVGGDIDLLTCPSDVTPPQQGGTSYALNAKLRGMTAEQYNALPDNFVVIVDSDRDEYTSVQQCAPRHAYRMLGGSQIFANAITKDGTINRYSNTGTVTARE